MKDILQIQVDNLKTLLQHTINADTKEEFQKRKIYFEAYLKKLYQRKKLQLWENSTSQE